MGALHSGGINHLGDSGQTSFGRPRVRSLAPAPMPEGVRRGVFGSLAGWRWGWARRGGGCRRFFAVLGGLVVFRGRSLSYVPRLGIPGRRVCVV